MTAQVARSWRPAHPVAGGSLSEFTTWSQVACGVVAWRDVELRDRSAEERGNEQHRRARGKRAGLFHPRSIGARAAGVLACVGRMRDFALAFGVHAVCACEDGWCTLRAPCARVLV
mmetsp:Transcript_5500/g.14359  ORF Transcript_5500/g.14359 Transcript_5500/m.14359 type:complete len:116 (+) Transcript_5500:1539-1886(+)